MLRDIFFRRSSAPPVQEGRSVPAYSLIPDLPAIVHSIQPGIQSIDFLKIA
jgi:hypothetical protein